MKHEEKLFVWQQTDRCFPVGDEQYPDYWIVEIMWAMRGHDLDSFNILWNNLSCKRGCVQYLTYVFDVVYQN